MIRTILHLDLDAFFCAVEELRDPALRGRRFAVGGSPNERGVVASCSYPARMLGVRSAMPMAKALKLCPGLIVVPGHHEAYEESSRAVMERLHGLSPNVEQVSIDEAFVDMSHVQECVALARRLQGAIRHELGLPCSIGIASNKLVAKIATEVGKSSAPKGSPPNALTVVPAGHEATFLAPLPVRMLWGVGPRTQERLEKARVVTIGDLAGLSVDTLTELLGQHGRDLHRHARGCDDSPVVAAHEVKSISQEVTFARDVGDGDTLRRTLRDLADQVARRLRKAGMAATVVKLKLRWADFTTITRQLSLKETVDGDAPIGEAALLLLDKAWRPRRPIRLIGVGVTGLVRPVGQLSLWDEAASPALQKAVDAVRDRFGDGAIRRGSAIHDRHR